LAVKIPAIDDPFVTFAEFPEYSIKYTRLHILRLMRRGEFPRSHQITKNRVGWRRSELLGWLDSRPVAKTAMPADAAE
jgi:predicted DNA-binding transcriptional regulator AlpA